MRRSTANQTSSARSPKGRRVEHTVETLRHTAIHNPPRVAESDAESVTDDDRQPHETKGTPEMTTYKERQHQQQITDLIASVADTETQIEMRSVANQYQRIRQALLVALSEFRQLDEEFGSKHDEADDLRKMLITLRQEEMTNHQMCIDYASEAI